MSNGNGMAPDDGDAPWIQDVICLAVPEGVDPDELVDEEGQPSRELLSVISSTVMAQYRRPPVTIVLDVSLLVTNQLADIEDFQPAHDCEECRKGNDTARQFLAEQPDRYVILGNLSYLEVWE